MFFSIAIPLYNKSYSISRCIDSVLSQSFTSFEIIIVNDGSSDDSLSIVEYRYINEIRSGLITIINQNNQGVSVARNNCINAANSEYICFLDADDEWLPNFLEKMNELIADYPDADLYCLAHMIKNDKVEKPVKPKHGLSDSHRGYIGDFFLSSCKGDVARSSKVCVRKASLVSIGCFPVGVVAGEDLYVWIRLAINGKVACDMEYVAIAHYEIDNSRKFRKNSIPYPILFFSKNKEMLCDKSLRRYLFVIFYKHFGKSLISLRGKEAILRLRSYLSMIM